VQRNLLALWIPVVMHGKKQLDFVVRVVVSMCVFIRHNAYFIIEELVDCGG
jgi:hypothetical protein